MKTINREQLLNQLESIRAGLSKRDTVEQSNCFAFDGGKVMSFNEDVACVQDTCVDNVTGAVPGEQLLNLLTGIPSEDVDVSATEGAFNIKAGKTRRAKLKLESDILLPLEMVEDPGKWKKLPSDFAEALQIATQCAGKDEDKYVTTCLYLSEDGVQATDNVQLVDYRLRLPITEACLVKSESMKTIIDLCMTHLSESDNWLHFKNGTGLVISFKKGDPEDFPKVEDFLDETGEAVSIPKGVIESLKIAKIFTQETESKDVEITIKPNALIVTGEGDSGKYQEKKKIKYTGEIFKFMIAPDLLAMIVTRFSTVLLNTNFLMIEGAKFKYMTCLGVVDE